MSGYLSDGKSFKVTILVFLLSCTGHKTDKPFINTDTSKTITVKKDSLIIPVQKVLPDSNLKNIYIDEKYFKEKTTHYPEISRGRFDSLDLGKIPAPTGLRSDISFKTKIIDTVVITGKIAILIAAVESENELWAWLLVYENGTLIQTEKLFYKDFVEYFSKTASMIKNNRIIISTETEVDGSKRKEIKKFIFKNREKLLLMK